MINLRYKSDGGLMKLRGFLFWAGAVSSLLLATAKAQSAPTTLPTSVPVINDLCGDGVLGLSEVCDDGNTTPEDGCSQDCQRLEQRAAFCGNGIVEATEQCDDANKVVFDGCSACQLEAPIPPPPPSDEGLRLFGIWRKEAKEPLSYQPTEEKSLQRALAFSVLGTLGPLVATRTGSFFLFTLSQPSDTVLVASSALFTTVSLGSLLIGPSLGYLYLGDKRHAVRLTLRRALSGGVIMLGGAVTIFGGLGSAGIIFTGLGIAAAGVVMYGVYAVGDIVSLTHATARHNQNLAATKERTLVLTPALLPATNGVIPGVAFGGRF